MCVCVCVSVSVCVCRFGARVCLVVLGQGFSGLASIVEEWGSWSLQEGEVRIKEGGGGCWVHGKRKKWNWQKHKEALAFLGKEYQDENLRENRGEFTRTKD